MAAAKPTAAAASVRGASLVFFFRGARALSRDIVRLRSSTLTHGLKFYLATSDKNGPCTFQAAAATTWTDPAVHNSNSFRLLTISAGVTAASFFLPTKLSASAALATCAWACSTVARLLATSAWVCATLACWRLTSAWD